MSNIAICQGWECWPCCLPASRNVAFNLKFSLPWLWLNYLTEWTEQNAPYTLYSQSASWETTLLELELWCLLLCVHMNLLLVTVLRQINPLRTCLTHLLTICYNSILSLCSYLFQVVCLLAFIFSLLFDVCLAHQIALDLLTLILP